jgi:hypothetical protein
MHLAGVGLLSSQEIQSLADSSRLVFVPRLTLLFVYHDHADCPHSLASALRARDRLLVVCCSEVSEQFLSREAVDAVLVHQDHLQQNGNLVAELKRVALRTPIILLRGHSQPKEPKPPGVAAVCCVDLEDEELVRSMWGFFCLILGKQALGSALAFASAPLERQ